MGTLALIAMLSVTAEAEHITLDEALALASKRNAALTIARVDREAAATEVQQSYVGVLPRLDLSASFGHQYEGAQQQITVIDNPTPPPDFVRVPTTYPANDYGQYQFGLNFTWTFFDGLSSWKRIAASKSRSDAAKLQLDEASLRVAFQVIQRFYELVRQQRTLDIRKKAVELSEQLVARADALFAAGRGTRADTYSARVNLGNDQLAVQTQAVAVVRARTDLAVTLGLSEGGLEVEAPETITQTGPPPAQELPPLSTLLARARKSRPLLAGMRRSVDGANLEIDRAVGAYWPTIALQAAYQKQSSDLHGTYGLLGGLDNQSTALVQVVVSLNLFAGGETRAGVEQAELQAHRAQALLDQGEETVVAEVTNARAQVASLTDSLALEQMILDEAEKSLQFARDRLEAGVGSQLEVRDAALKLSQAKLTWVGSLVDLAVARADLNRSVGGSL